METGSARTFYYKVKYGPKDEIYYVTKDDICPPPVQYVTYKYTVYFKVESCWNADDGSEAVKKWCIKNIKNYTQLLRVLFLIVTQKLRETVAYQ